MIRALVGDDEENIRNGFNSPDRIAESGNSGRRGGRKTAVSAWTAMKK